MNYIDKIEKSGACGDAVMWLRENNYETLQQAWDDCERGDWMHWLLSRSDLKETKAVRRNLALLACAHAREVLPEWEKRHLDDHRPRLAIEASERWAKKQTEENRAAARAAADAAARAAAYAADAAYAACAAAGAAVGARKQQAINVRRFFPKAPKAPKLGASKP